MSTQPTPEDLEALLLAQHPASKHYLPAVKAKIVAAMQAAVSKWGTPATGGEPVAWEWRWKDTSPHTVTSGQWSEWKRVEARSRLSTVEDAVREFQHYIADGAAYELRQLYTSPQPVREPAGWLYDWFSDEGELVRDWFTTDHDEAHSEANQAHNIRALDYRGTSPQPVREPLSTIDLMRVVMKADEETQDTRGTTNWAAHIGKAVQAAVLSGGAQPVREPLTPERVKEIVCEAGYDCGDTPDPERAAFISGLRHGEVAHGITGGQHGTQT